MDYWISLSMLSMWLIRSSLLADEDAPLAATALGAHGGIDSGSAPWRKDLLALRNHEVMGALDGGSSFKPSVDTPACWAIRVIRAPNGKSVIWSAIHSPFLVVMTKEPKSTGVFVNGNGGEAPTRGSG